MGSATTAFPAAVEEAGRQLLMQKCSACHGVDLAYKEVRPKAAWEVFIKGKQRLVKGKEGLELSDAHVALLVEYLADYVGPEIQARRSSRARLFLIGTGAFFLIMAITIYIGVRQRTARSATAGENDGRR